LILSRFYFDPYLYPYFDLYFEPMLNIILMFNVYVFDYVYFVINEI